MMITTRYANPGQFMALSAKLLPIFALLSVCLLAAGLYLALIVAPPDYQQGNAARIMYVHVPAAWTALFVYASMAMAAITGLVWRHIVADLYARAAAPLGAAFTFICLATGSIWGKPMWGTWWVWDARLTSVLILFFLYLGYIALINAFDDEDKGLKAGSWLLVVGIVNVPIIKFSVDWWQTLHQPASILRLDGPKVATSMLAPLLTMASAFMVFFGTLVLLRLRTEILRRKQRVQALQRG